MDGLIAAICASPAYVLAPNGLIDGPATCYPTRKAALGLNYVDETVVLTGKLITSQGPATSTAFALKCVELLLGPEKSKDMADQLLF